MSIQVMNSFSILGNFAIDGMVLYIGNRDLILGLSWSMEHRFSVDTQDRCLRNVKTGKGISSSVKWMPEVIIIEQEALRDGEILLIIDGSER